MLIVLIILLLLVGGFGYGGPAFGLGSYGWGPTGATTVVVIVLLFLLLSPGSF